jgi:hypothetical protein
MKKVTLGIHFVLRMNKTINKLNVCQGHLIY